MNLVLMILGHKTNRIAVTLLLISMLNFLFDEIGPVVAITCIWQAPYD